jgi:DNA-binding transcriptional regulator GbsR (MarR family)
LYGLLFVSPRPLSMADLSGRLRLSKGATSQGLKFLRNLGAVRGVYVDGDRRDHFVAETELRKLMDGFLREQVRPHLKSGGERLERMRGLANQLSGPDQSWYAERAERLQRWQSRAERMLPFVVRLTHL